MAVDGSGDVFIADSGNNRVVEATRTLSQGVVTYGSPVAVVTGLNYPSAVALDGAGDLFIADSTNNRISEQKIDGSLLVVGSGLKGPEGLAVDGTGNVFIADTLNSRVEEVAAGPAVTVVPPPPTVTTGAASAISATGATLNAAVNPNGGPTATMFQYSTNASFTTLLASGNFNSPRGVAVDGSGDVFVANLGNNEVDEILPGGSVKAIGSGFKSPTGVAVDSAGDVYVANNGLVQELHAGTGAITTVGSGFTGPYGVAVDGSGNVFVDDITAGTIFKVTPAGTTTTVASGFNKPRGVAVDGKGDVFVADSGNDAVKEVLPGGNVLTIGSGFGFPDGVAVDGKGDVFVVDQTNKVVDEVLPGGSTFAIASGLGGLGGVAVDAAGDAFVSGSDLGGLVDEFPPIVSAAPSPLSGTTAQAASAGVTGLTGLTQGATYYARALASNAGGTTTGAATSFTIPLGTVVSEGDGTLDVIGTNGADTISLAPAGQGQVQVTINGHVSGPYATGGKGVQVFGLGGNDTISVASSYTGPTFLYGGDGNDTLTGGAGHDYIDGGAGTNYLGAPSGGNDVILNVVGVIIHGAPGNNRILIEWETSNPEGSGVLESKDPHVDFLVLDMNGVVTPMQYDPKQNAGATIIVYGGSGNNYIQMTDQGAGQHWNAEFHGGPHDNTLIASSQLFGDEGIRKSYLYGGGGTNILVGGAGQALLVGGPGKNTFILGTGQATIQGFTALDTIIRGTGNYDVADVALPATGLGASFDAYVATAYEEELGRLPDAAELALWTRQRASGAATSQIAATLAVSAEHRSLVASGAIQSLRPAQVEADALAASDRERTMSIPGSFPGGPIGFTAAALPASGFGATRDAIVGMIYTEELGRVPDQVGLRYWSRLLAEGASPSKIVAAIARTPEHRSLVASGAVKPLSARRVEADAVAASKIARTLSAAGKVPSKPVHHAAAKPRKSAAK